MENTTNLKLPLLIPNQSQKEITHNEALVVIDNLLNNGVIDKDLTTPPETPAQNALYIVTSGATGLWEGQDKNLAYYDNGWKFNKALTGTIYWVNDENCLYVFNGTNWLAYTSGGGTSGAVNFSELQDVVLSALANNDIIKYNGTAFINSNELQNITKIGINTDADTNNKLSVKSDYVLFDKATANSRIKVNKATSADTASHLFQSNYEGRAEFGLTGSDDFTLKVSSDGSVWNNSFVVDNATGNIDFKGIITNNGNSLGSGMPMPINTANAIGQIKLITSASGAALSTPSGRTWAILSSFAVNQSTAIIYDYGADNPTSFVVAGGAQIRPGRSGYIQEAYVIRIQ